LPILAKLKGRIMKSNQHYCVLNLRKFPKSLKTELLKISLQRHTTLQVLIPSLIELGMDKHQTRKRRIVPFGVPEFNDEVELLELVEEL